MNIGFQNLSLSQARPTTSGSTADKPEPTTFSDLPDEILFEIAKRVQAGDVYQGTSLLLTDKKMKKIASPLLPLPKQYETCRQYVQSCWKRDELPRHLEAYCNMPLNWIKPSARAELVNAVLASPENGKPKYIGQLGKQLGFFTRNQQGRLVQEILRLSALDAEQQGESDAVRMLSAFVEDGVQHLAPEQRELLLNAGLSYSNSIARTCAIQGFAAGLQHFLPEQKTMLLHAAFNISDPFYQGKALGAFGRSLKYLPPEDRSLLVNATVNNPSEKGKAFAIRGMGAGLAFLTPEQRRRLVDAALGMQDATLQALTIAGLGENLSLLTPEQGNALAKILPSAGEFKVNLKQASPVQKKLLLDGTLKLESYARKSEAIGSIAKGGVQYLTHEQYELLLNVGLDLPYDLYRAKVIGKLGSGLRYLTSEQCTKLLNHAFNLPDNVRGEAVSGIARGGIDCLTPPQQTQFLKSLGRIDSFYRGLAYGDIGAELRCFSETDRKRILNVIKQPYFLPSHKVLALPGVIKGILALEEEPKR